MPDERFKLDVNSRSGGVIGGYSSSDPMNEEEPTLIVVRIDPITGRLLVNATIVGADIQIGAVEIKNSTDDTRATVDAYGLATKATIKETTPTDSSKVNASLGLAYDGNGNLITLTKVIGGVTYTKTLTYVANVLTAISVWS